MSADTLTTESLCGGAPESPDRSAADFRRNSDRYTLLRATIRLQLFKNEGAMNEVPLPDASPAAPRDVSRWRLADVELDEATLELRRGGQLVAIERKPLELLMWLLRHPGEVITKEELFDALWADRVVTESVLTKCVAKLRQALGDDSQNMLKTVHGFGYRLVAPVERLAMLAHPQPAGPSAMQAGDTPPQRPNWQLVHRFEGARGENWLARHAKSGEQRVFKFGLDAAGMAQLKREITLHRLLRDTLGPRDDLVRVLDWNLSEPPYFVELQHCSQGSLRDWLASTEGGAAAVPLATRLELVAQTADALAAAHSAGVLHKDIKPANVLIELDASGAPRVRLGDFGSGQVLDAERLLALEITRMGFTQTLAADTSTSGTWAYLAPELVAGQAPTVRSDIFALGVLLYQLAVGDLKRPLAPGWERDIADTLLRVDVAACCDQEPLLRLGDAAELARRLRALPERLAEQEAAFRREAQAQALQQALASARERRKVLGGLAAVACTGLAVALVLLWQVRDARLLAEAAAAQSAAQAQSLLAVNRFLTQDLVAAANPLQTGRRDLSMRDALSVAEAAAGARFAEQPLQEAALQRALGNAFHGLSDFSASRRALERSLALAAAHGGDADSRAQTALELLTTLFSVDGDLQAQRAALDTTARLAALPEVSERTRIRWRIAEAAWLNGNSRFDEALQAYAALRAPTRAAFGAGHEQYAELVGLMVEARLGRGIDDEALALAREALALKRGAHGADHPRTLEQMRQLAAALRSSMRFDETAAVLAEAGPRANQSLGAEHDVALRIETEAALLALDRRQFDEAERRFRAALTMREHHYGSEHADTRVTMNNLAFTLGELGRLPESLLMFQRVHELMVRAYGQGHARTLTSLQNIARTHMDMQQWRAAAAVQGDLLARAEAAIPAHWHRGLMLLSAGQTQLQLGNQQAARLHLAHSLQILQASRGTDHTLTQRARSLLATLGPA